MDIRDYHSCPNGLLDRLRDKKISRLAFIMRSATMALGFCLCLFTLLAESNANLAHAMPTTNAEDGRPKPIRSGSVLNTPFKPSVTGQLTNPYDDLFRTLEPLNGSFYRLDEKGQRIALTKEERDALSKILSSADDASSGNPMGLEQSYQSANRSERDILLQEFEADIDSLYDDLQVNRQVGSPTVLPQGAPAQSSFEAGPRVLRVVPSRTSDDLPILSAVPLGAVFLESVKAIIKDAGHSGESLASLRDFVFVQQPENGSIMMVDNGTGYTVMLHSNEQSLINNRPQNGFSSGPEMQSANSPIMASNFDHRPLHLRIWDFLTSTAALVFYGFVIICWAAWRYVISRYV